MKTQRFLAFLAGAYFTGIFVILTEAKLVCAKIGFTPSELRWLTYLAVCFWAFLPIVIHLSIKIGREQTDSKKL